jgi:FkbM family methyltransferase
MTFYGQALEDKFLYENYFTNKRNGTYLELGALDGILYSNTKFFEDQLNWTGILIEPNSYQFKMLAENRPNNKLFNNLISNTTDEVIYKYFIDDFAGVSGIKHTLPTEHYRGFYDIINKPNGEILMRPVTLTNVIKQTDFKHFDLLSLDVEGHEYEVLCSWDFSVPIDIIFMETLGGSQEDKGNLCHELLISKGYAMDKCYKDNKVYIFCKEKQVHPETTS